MPRCTSAHASSGVRIRQLPRAVVAGQHGDRHTTGVDPKRQTGLHRRHERRQFLGVSPLMRIASHQAPSWMSLTPPSSNAANDLAAHVSSRAPRAPRPPSFDDRRKVHGFNGFFEKPIQSGSIDDFRIFEIPVKTDPVA